MTAPCPRGVRWFLAVLSAIAMAFTLPAMAHAAPTDPKAATAGSAADIVFSDPVAADGIKAWPGDPDKTPADVVSSRAGVPCWQTGGTAKDQYIYLDVDSARIPAGATDAVLTVKYYDTPGQQLIAQYDGVGAAFTPTPWFTFPGTGMWATTQFSLANLQFSNRANGADIRLMANAPGGTISTVCLASASVSFADTTGITVTNQSLVFQQGSGSVALTSSAAQVAWSITDDQLLPVASGTAAVSGGTGSVPVSTLGPGYYHLRLTEGSTVVGTTLAVLPALPSGTQSTAGKWGVNTHMSHYYNLSSSLIRTLALTGFSHIRDSLEWPNVETGSPGNYVVNQQYDAVIADAKANGITPLLVTGYRNPLYDGGKTPSTPAGLAAFGRYESYWLGHFSGTTNNIETYNEYYQPGFNDSACGVTGACFVQLMKAAYQQTHADNPNANVIADVGPNSGDTSFRDQVMAGGGMAYVDSINAHIYTFEGPEGDLDKQLQDLRAKADANGGAGKPIWVSEEGYPTAPSFGGSMADQARKSIRNDVLMLANGVSQFYWYDALNDGTNTDDKESTFGLLAAPAGPITGMAPKPALVAKATTIRALTGLDYSGRDALAAPLYSYKFGSGAATTRALWSTGTGTSTVEFATGSPVQLTDMYGHRTTLTPSGGVVTLTVDQDPVFVKGAVSSVTATTAPEVKAVIADPSNPIDPTAVTVSATGAAHLSGQLNVTVAGKTVPMKVAPGKGASVTLTAPPTDTLGQRHLVATVSRGKSAIARLVAWTNVKPPTSVRVVPQIGKVSPLQASMGVQVTNARTNKTVTVRDLAWSLGGQQGTAGAGTAIPPGGTVTIDVPAPGVDAWRAYPYKVDVTTDDGNTTTGQGTTAFDPIVPSGSATASSLDLATDGKWQKFTRDWGGAADLSGSADYQYDADGLTVNAAVTDDVASQTETAPTMWRGDSLQFAISAGLPGESTTSTQIGAALLPTGPSVYTFSAADGSAAGATAGASADITRSGGVTTYHVKLPWKALGFAGTPQEPVAISLALNDNDGSGRAGAMTWGGGIVTGINSGLYLPATFIAADI
jgi:hypothetical protein